MNQPEAKTTISFNLDELSLLGDALSYYRLSTQGGGPAEHSVAEIEAVEDRIEAGAQRLHLAYVRQMAAGDGT